VAPDDLRHVTFRETEVPGPTGIYDGVRAVFAEAEAVDGVYADVPSHASFMKLVFECLADIFRASFLAVATLADEHVDVVVPDLRVGFRPRPRREGAVRPCRILFGLLRFLLGDNFSGLAPAIAG
jgi:hypothetical protein